MIPVEPDANLSQFEIPPKQTFPNWRKLWKGWLKGLA
jgi:hypothetical protein